VYNIAYAFTLHTETISIKMIMLVVDSSVVIIEKWQRILSATKHIKTIYGAVAYNDAIMIFNSVKPDVILLDGDLPGNTSIELLKVFKETGEQARVIVTANNADKYMEQQCKLFGADFFFDKYNDFEKIPAFINDNAGVHLSNKNIHPRKTNT
jgi:DNA-binding NarL/FixJ family response regulator